MADQNIYTSIHTGADIDSAITKIQNLKTLPSGGTAGQALIKTSHLEGEAAWQDIQALPEGGTTGQILVKSSDNDGEAAWQDIQALPVGGFEGQVLAKKSATDGDVNWVSDLSGNSATTTKLKTAVTIALSGDVTGSIEFDGSESIDISTIIEDNSHTHTWSNISDRATCTINTSGTITGSKVYGAVYNDYAEYREAYAYPGRCIVENGDGTLRLSRSRLEPAPEIISDTFGFSIGETDKCKAPVAVAGRVLAYPYEPKEEFSAGDPVCSGPNGTISKMTREEVCMYPDRMIGTVSEIPIYDTWGQDNIEVNGRIWIRIR